ncbi:hypothetical protein BT96DRAFT_395953 [Gymnopus androsaceus JB14]|uniref:Uncharacterized protein n=1 Tax=Gymnopus androsaceus JB14 TaxID=1447944 RepID=A0A6A4I2T5_9AGAR|nr:hypothetical protein BT96DRAFT_395953 [Gymnopus androsaceus JB14]
MYNNGFYNGQAAGSSQSHYQTQNNSNPSQVMRHPFTLTAADALRARQIMLEDQQRLVAEQLAMEEAKEREAARLFAEAALLEDQIASAEASRVRLDAIKQQLGIPNRPMLTYEPTPATTQIVPVEEDQGSHGSSPMHQQNATNFTQNQSQQNAYTAQLRALQAAQQQQIQQSQQYASAQRAQTHAFQPGSQSYQQMHSSQQQRPNPYPPTHSSAQPLQYNHPSSGATQQQSVQRPQFPLPSNIQTSVQSPPSFSSLTATGVTQRQPQAQAVPQSQNNQRVQSLQATSQQASSNAQRSSSAQQSSHMVFHCLISSSVILLKSRLQAAAPSAVMNVPQSQSQYHTTQHPERQTTATTMNSNPQLTSADTERLKALHHHAGVWAKQAKPGKMERIRGTHLFVRSEPNQGYTVGFMGENGFVAITVDQAIQPLREINFLPPSVAAATTPTNVPAQPSPTIPSTTATGAAAQVNAMRTTNIPPNSSSAVAPNTYPPNTYPHTPHMTVNPKVLDLHPHASSSPKPQSLIVLNDAPSTPTNKKTDSNARPSPRTPAEANKKSLARDLLRALGPPSQKRRRESESDDRAAKRQALVDITVAQAAQSTINASAAAIQTPVLNYQVPGQPIPAPTALQPPARTLTAGGVTNVQSGIKAAGVESSGSALSAQPLQSTASVGNTPSAINPALVLQSPDPTKQSTTTSSENPVSPNKKGFAVNSSPFNSPDSKTDSTVLARISFSVSSHRRGSHPHRYPGSRRVRYRARF